MNKQLAFDISNNIYRFLTNTLSVPYYKVISINIYQIRKLQGPHGDWRPYIWWDGDNWRYNKYDEWRKAKSIDEAMRFTNDDDVGVKLYVGNHTGNAEILRNSGFLEKMLKHFFKSTDGTSIENATEADLDAFRSYTSNIENFNDLFKKVPLAKDTTALSELTFWLKDFERDLKEKSFAELVKVYSRDLSEFTLKGGINHYKLTLQLRQTSFFRDEWGLHIQVTDENSFDKDDYKLLIKGTKLKDNNETLQNISWSITKKAGRDAAMPFKEVRFPETAELAAKEYGRLRKFLIFDPGF